MICRAAARSVGGYAILCYMKKLIFAFLILASFGSQPAQSEVDTRKLASSDGKTAAYVFGSRKNKPSYVELRSNTGYLKHALQHSVPAGEISFVEFSPDASLIVVAVRASFDPRANEPRPKIFGQVRVWNTYSGKLLHEITEPNATIMVVTFSPDGKTIAVGSGDGRIRFWDVSSGKISRAIYTGQYVTSLAFSPNSQKLASTLWDDKVRIWNVSDGKIWKLLDVKDEANPISKASFSTNGQIITTTGLRGPMRQWNVSTGKVLKTFKR